MNWNELEESFRGWRTVEEIVRTCRAIDEEVPFLKVVLTAIPSMPEEAVPYASAYAGMTMDLLKNLVMKVQHLFLAIAEMDVVIPSMTERVLQDIDEGDYISACNNMEKLIRYVYDVLCATVLERENIAVQLLAEGGEE